LMTMSPMQHPITSIPRLSLLFSISSGTPFDVHRRSDRQGVMGPFRASPFTDVCGRNDCAPEGVSGRVAPRAASPSRVWSPWIAPGGDKPLALSTRRRDARPALRTLPRQPARAAAGIDSFRVSSRCSQEKSVPVGQPTGFMAQPHPPVPLAHRCHSPNPSGR
jgi:hypothetical protein